MMKKLQITLVSLCLGLVMQAQSAWTQKSDFPSNTYDGVCFAIGDNVYFGLGFDENLNSETNTMYKFNTITNTWTTIAAYPGGTRRGASAFAIQGKGYVCLGASTGVEQTDLWQYDPILDTWTAKANFPGVGRAHGFADVVNGKAYVGTGIGYNTGYPMDTYEYSPSSDSWAVKASQPGIASWNSQTFVINDTIYLVGGQGGPNLIEHNEFWAYSVIGDSWTQKADFPGGAPRVYGTSFSLNGKGYYGYGMLSVWNYLGDFYSFSQNTNTWTSIPGNGNMMLFNEGYGGVATATAGYCISGILSTNPSSPTTQVWQFIPSTTTNTLATVVKDNELMPNNQLQIRPNPARNFVEIKATLAGTYEVSNAIGQNVKSFNLKENEVYNLELGDLSGGTYYVKHSSNSGVVRKLIVYR